jgi:hypothetical protein
MVFILWWVAGSIVGAGINYVLMFDTTSIKVKEITESTSLRS